MCKTIQWVTWTSCPKNPKDGKLVVQGKCHKFRKGKKNSGSDSWCPDFNHGKVLGPEANKSPVCGQCDKRWKDWPEFIPGLDDDSKGTETPRSKGKERARPENDTPSRERVNSGTWKKDLISALPIARPTAQRSSLCQKKPSPIDTDMADVEWPTSAQHSPGIRNTYHQRQRSGGSRGQSSGVSAVPTTPTRLATNPIFARPTPNREIEMQDYSDSRLHSSSPSDVEMVLDSPKQPSRRK